MSELLVIRDVLRGGREWLELTQGANLAAELRRLFPGGLRAPWELYAGEVHPDCYLPFSSHERIVVDAGRYVLVVKPAGPVLIPWWVVTIFTIGIQLITAALATKPRAPDAQSQEATSPNNELAGQTNLLRAGARVPDILGAVRAYPDLMCPPIETWTSRTQTLTQFMVLGVGDYTLTNPQLGETPLSSIGGPPTLNQFKTTDTVPPITAVKTSPEISAMALSVDATQAFAQSAVFAASGKTLTTQNYVPLTVGSPIRIDSTTSNNGFYDVTAAAPSTQINPPFVYTLDGAVVNESAPAPLIRVLEVLGAYTSSAGNLGGMAVSGTQADLIYASVRPVVGSVLRFVYVNSSGVTVNVIGVVATASYYTYTSIATGYQYHAIITMNNFSGVIITWPTPQSGSTVFHITQYKDPGAPPAVVASGADPRDTQYNLPTAWYVAPLLNPAEIWIDIAFPSGLIWYQSGVAKPYTVGVTAEFRRLGASAVGATLTWNFTGQSQGNYRWTQRIDVASLALPAGSGYIQVRLTRTTVFVQDDGTNQYVTDCRWQRLAATQLLPSNAYPNVTVLQLIMQNTRSAVTAGSTESTFNCVATRLLPHWTGSAWSAPVATEKWADNLVGRMKATDGANKADADIDLAGIYAIQTTLDARDSGDAGKISMTLDTLADMDTELQTIASVVRCSVYRVGRKLFVTRDQGGKTAVALFTGRSKSPDGETVTMTFKNDSENDAVIVQWIDRANGWKIREYQYPVAVTANNPLRVSPPLATWAQAWRRSQYEWNRGQLRRDALMVAATDEARLVHIGDVVNVSDDVANLAQSVGEVIALSTDGLSLTLDKPMTYTGAASGYTLLLRSQDGRTLDAVPLAATSAGNLAVLSRAAAFALKGRDDGMGSIYAIYQTQSAVLRPWLVTGLDPDPPYTRMTGANYREDIYAGDTAALPGVPPFAAVLAAPAYTPPQWLHLPAGEVIE